MELQILVSKKGTKVVTASNLHLVLDLPKAQFAKNVRRWVHDVYEFRDGIRKPENLRDYAKRPANDAPYDDFYLSVEFAKVITLASTSKSKMKYATRLLQHEDRYPSDELLDPEQVLALVELSKVMGLVSCQTASEQLHRQSYEERNNGTTANWWSFRSDLLGYSGEDLREAMLVTGKKPEGKSQRQMLVHLDKHEMVRTAVIDLFMALGKTERSARQLGDLAKHFAKELNVEIFDDRDAPAAFLPALVNSELANEVKDLKKGRYLQLWEPRRMAS